MRSVSVISSPLIFPATTLTLSAFSRWHIKPIAFSQKKNRSAPQFVGLNWMGSVGMYSQC